MALESRGKDSSVAQQLLGESHRFDFFQAVRLLERLHAEQSRSLPSSTTASSLGADGPPRLEPVRFKTVSSLSFPSSAVREIRVADAPPGSEPETAPRPFEMRVAFMGLTGPMGVLPQHYSVLLIDRLREKDSTFRDFLDLFNHRLISLFYRAWRKYRLPFSYEQESLNPPHEGQEQFSLTTILYSLIGLGTPGGKLHHRMAIDDEALLYYAGYFAGQTRTAGSLETMLADYFEVPVRIEQFHGCWLYINHDEISRMPCPAYPDGVNIQLGATAIAGERVWDVESTFRVHIGPLNYPQFCNFLPAAKGYRQLVDLVRYFVGPDRDFVIQPVLQAAEVPAGSFAPDAQPGIRLGQTGWLCSKPLTRDFDEALFTPN